MDLNVLGDTFGYLLRRAWRDVDRRFQYHFRTLRLTAPQYSILILVNANPDCTPGDLVQPLGISQNNLVGIIGDLIDRGYVRKAAHSQDRRARILALTESGSAVLAEAHAAHAVYAAEYLRRIGADNLRELVRLLTMFDAG
ncbi:MAG: MarR family transcriptional regulator [Sphingomonas bacterium]|nr:MarR family transcriptional regulator [Sphingomonas bacterium]